MVGVGFQLPLSYGGAPVLTTLSFIDSTVSTSATITGSASIQAGDLLVLVDMIGDKVGSNTIPAGFTGISNVAQLNDRVRTSYKIADGSEASASITGMDGSLSDGKILMVFRGNIPVSSVTAQDVETQATDADPTAQTVTASGGATPLIVFGSYFCRTNNVGTRTMSPAGSEISVGTPLRYAKYLIYNSSPSDVTVDMNDSGSINILTSFYLEVA